MTKINLKPVINKNNGQVNFSLRKKDLPETMRDKLPKLKKINISEEDFDFDL